MSCLLLPVRLRRASAVLALSAFPAIALGALVPEPAPAATGATEPRAGAPGHPASGRPASATPGAALGGLAVVPGISVLAAIDVPLTAELITRVGLTESAVTTALAETTGRRYVRLRAVGALPFFATKSARALVEQIAAGDPDEVVRIQAVTSLARGFGGADPMGVLNALRTLARTATPAVAEAIAAEWALLAPATEPGGASTRP